MPDRAQDASRMLFENGGYPVMKTLAYLFMGMGLFSFAAMGIVHKLGDRMRAQPLSLALLAMATGSALSFLHAALFEKGALSSVPHVVLLLALPFGTLAALALWFFQRALRHGHIATSWLMINLSAGIPTVLSMIFYHEPLTAKKLVVLFLVIVALVLLWWDRRGQTPESC